MAASTATRASSSTTAYCLATVVVATTMHCTASSARSELARSFVCVASTKLEARQKPARRAEWYYDG